MLSVTEERKREDLFREISDTICQWPELERKVFSLAHYRGQSLADIARSLKLNAEKVGVILKQCDRGLHDSLRNFLESKGEEASFDTNKEDVLSACVRDLKTTPVFASKASPIPRTHRLTA
jgi:hypothetical protein